MTVSLRYIIGFVVFLWVAALFYDTLLAPPPEFVFGEVVFSERSRPLLLLVAVMLVTSAMLILIMRPSYISEIARAPAPIVFAFVLTLILAFLSILQADISAVAYSAFFLSVLIVTYYVNRRFSDIFYLAVSIALGSSLIVFFLYHGSPNGRWIGTIHPNYVGAFAFAAVYFAARSRNRARWGVYAIGLIFSTLVSSRYATVAIVIIIIFDYLQTFQLSAARIFWLLLVAFVLLLVAVTASEFIYSNILSLDDPDRGIGSGMTGRMDMWGEFWGQFVQRPFIGYGFRNRGAYEGTHNGFLNFFLETGVIASFMLVGVVLGGIWRSVFIYSVDREPREIMRLGLWIAWLVAALLMPQLINFGDAFGLITVFLLTDGSKLQEK